MATRGPPVGISERLSRWTRALANELAALRQMVNKTLQELRGFIFELRRDPRKISVCADMRRYVRR